MNTIFHHQNLSYNHPDIFVIDGLVSEYGTDQRQQEAIEIIKNNRRLKKIIIPKHLSDSASQSLEVYIGINDLFIRSTSKTLDNNGRYISFEYYNRSHKDVENIMISLASDANKAGLELNDGDLNVIKWILSILPLEKIIILSSLGVCLLSIIVSLIN